MLINISDELADHYQLVKQAARDAVDDANETGAAKSALLNATTTILKELARVQQELFNSSNIAILQATIVSCLSDCDQNFKDKVVEELERRLLER